MSTNRLKLAMPLRLCRFTMPSSHCGLPATSCTGPLGFQRCNLDELHWIAITSGPQHYRWWLGRGTSAKSTCLMLANGTQPDKPLAITRIDFSLEMKWPAHTCQYLLLFGGFYSEFSPSFFMFDGLVPARDRLHLWLAPGGRHARCAGNMQRSRICRTSPTGSKRCPWAS